MVLANEDSPMFLSGGFCALPQQMAVMERLPEAFKSDIGLTYDALGTEVDRGVERLLAPRFRTNSFRSRFQRLNGVNQLRAR
jgi:hypothetical protein